MRRVDLLRIAARVATAHRRVALEEILDSVQKSCPAELRSDVGKFLGSGKFGETYEVDGGDKVLKIAIARTAAEADSVLDHVRRVSRLDSDVFVKAHDFGVLCGVEVPRGTKYVNKAGVAYFYVMDRLAPLPAGEAQIAARTLEDLAQIEKSGIAGERAERRRRYLSFKTKQYARSGDIDEGGPDPVAKAFDLFERMTASGVGHGDVHGDNIMQDSEGRYKLIDLEAAKLLGKS